MNKLKKKWGKYIINKFDIKLLNLGGLRFLFSEQKIFLGIKLGNINKFFYGITIILW